MSYLHIYLQTGINKEKNVQQFSVPVTALKGHLYLLDDSWISMCLFNLSLRLKAVSQISHENGVSPV